jgi:cytochrome P450
MADLAEDPYSVFGRLREVEPVSWVPEVGMWLLTRYDDVVEVLRDHSTFTTESAASPIQATFGRQMLSHDGPERRAYKTFCMESFTVPALEQTMAAEIDDLVERYLDRAGGGRAIELVGALAAPVALESVCLVLGLPVADVGRLHGWYGHFAAALANFEHDATVAERGHFAAGELRAYLADELTRAREEGGRTLLHRLADPERCDWRADEVFSNLMIILFGGIETTESMIANALWALLRHPEHLTLARRDSRRLERAIEESLRWEPAVQSCTRYATTATEIRGVPIAQGEVVQCMLGAANRDPGRFPDPDVFDPERGNAGDHLAFGVGRHFCLGAHLARMEARLAIGSLLRRCPHLRADPARPARIRGYEFRKPRELWALTAVPSGV